VGEFQQAPAAAPFPAVAEDRGASVYHGTATAKVPAAAENQGTTACQGSAVDGSPAAAGECGRGLETVGHDDERLAGLALPQSAGV
jgi:hypothetical protein